MQDLPWLAGSRFHDPTGYQDEKLLRGPRESVGSGTDRSGKTRQVADTAFVYLLALSIYGAISLRLIVP
jgi:hypothetical protein